jgi:hypothetical protein
MSEQGLLGVLLTSHALRLMSDYDVTLVNDSMQEFYVWFYGPSESAQFLSHPIFLLVHERGFLQLRSLVGSGRST